ncbi:hypothetical protein BYT27DRAFT_7045955, partial [Phlegmacium glaucopus]
YSKSLQEFITFCGSEQVPDHLRFPANKYILYAFAVSSVGCHSGSTVQNLISSFKAWHIAHNLDWK